LLLPNIDREGFSSPTPHPFSFPKITILSMHKSPESIFSNFWKCKLILRSFFFLIKKKKYSVVFNGEKKKCMGKRGEENFSLINVPRYGSIAQLGHPTQFGSLPF
jgi:hypothetical protein